MYWRSGSFTTSVDEAVQAFEADVPDVEIIEGAGSIEGDVNIAEIIQLCCSRHVKYSMT